jgi:plastocyanin
MIAPSSLSTMASSGSRSWFSSPLRFRPTIAALALAAASTAFAATVHTVSQKGRNFAVGQVTIARGDSVHFTNEDEFIHQIYIDSKDMTFDSAEQLPGQAIDVNFPRTGIFPVRCHIHPKMLLSVRVE